MSDTNMDRLVDLWMSDPDFRDDVRKDTNGAIAKTGIVLNDEEKAAISRLDLANLTNEELEARISKAAGLRTAY